ncbi:leucine-rich repeat and calponin homology domain-containing protein 4 isoform X2 [Rhinatrema bivittatum]|uniref:leucine-rich repeat and calponin homology domain-containing protein 4 isoform X2 n=1 Tax=Rhinatrema bivittatum TaxID=194408 RepID=UPI001128117B|nr:leucine-rich repeat and calponin homology domain-containing protein 4 isoform X2 [Rhinatrema bivittatum]
MATALAAAPAGMLEESLPPVPFLLVGGRGTEKALEEAAASGVLNLGGRKLKEFPRGARNYDLSDITQADLSKNRFAEIPEDACHLISLECLSLYHNCLRNIPLAITNLQTLTYLNISRNQLSLLPPYICHLPLKVLIASNNKLVSLPDNIGALKNLRQLDVSCNELQSLPAQLGKLESLRHLNLRRNQLMALPEELSELPLVHLDVSCNRITKIPVCYRHLRHLQFVLLENNPLQSPPAQICLKGKIHIFKYLNIEACRKAIPDLTEFTRVARPTGFETCLTEEFFPVRQYGGLDSGFNSVDSGSKRWSGNESTDEFSDLSFRIAELAKDPKQLKEKQNGTGDGDLEQIDYIDDSTNGEEDDDVKSDCGLQMTVFSEEKSKTERTSPQKTDVGEKSVSSRPVSITAISAREEPGPGSEERRRPETLQIWQERERQQQALRGQVLEKRESWLKLMPKSTPINSQSQNTSTKNGPHENSSSLFQKQKSQNLDPPVNSRSAASTVPPSHQTDALPSQHSSAPMLSPKEGGTVQKPNSFLFRSSSRNSVRPNSVCSPIYGPLDLTPSEPHSPVRLRAAQQVMDEKALLAQLRKNIESRLNITLADDLGEALANGAVLCQLANHLRPRCIAFIHVPSPAVPKLNIIKSRKNVENFLEACRKMGVSEVDLCLPSDILQGGVCSVERTVRALLRAGGGGGGPAPAPRPSLAFHCAGFSAFYVLVMLLLYVAYCKLAVF